MVLTKRVVVTTLVTWIFFSLEAFIHFSMGKDKLEAPSIGEIFKIFGVVLVFALLASFFSDLAVKVCCETKHKGANRYHKHVAAKTVYLDESDDDL